MKEEIKRCPLCGRDYRGRPAVSRTDGRTEICQLCGTKQSLEALGISREESEQIIAIVAKYNSWNFV